MIPAESQVWQGSQPTKVCFQIGWPPTTIQSCLPTYPKNTHQHVGNFFPAFFTFSTLTSPITWFGSSQDLVQWFNNHGRTSPVRIGLWDPFQIGHDNGSHIGADPITTYPIPAISSSKQPKQTPCPKPKLARGFNLKKNHPYLGKCSDLTSILFKWVGSTTNNIEDFLDVFNRFFLFSDVYNYPTQTNTTLPSWLIVSSTHVDVEPRPGKLCGDGVFLSANNGVNQAERSFNWLIFFCFFCWLLILFGQRRRFFSLQPIFIVFITKFVSFCKKSLFFSKHSINS